MYNIAHYSKQTKNYIFNGLIGHKDKKKKKKTIHVEKQLFLWNANPAQRIDNFFSFIFVLLIRLSR